MQSLQYFPIQILSAKLYWKFETAENFEILGRNILSTTFIYYFKSSAQENGNKSCPIFYKIMNPFSAINFRLIKR